MNRLKELREDRDLTQREMAQILNMSQSNYSKYEKETLFLNYKQLIKIAQYYQVSIDYILYQTDERKTYKRSLLCEEDTEYEKSKEKQTN